MFLQGSLSAYGSRFGQSTVDELLVCVDSHSGRSTLLGIVTMLLAVSFTFGGISTAQANVDCDGGHASATCRIVLLPGLTLETNVGAMNESGYEEFTINGDVYLVTDITRIPLQDSSITVKLGDAPEIYGETEVPLDRMPLLQDADFKELPRAVIGLVNGSTLPELVGEPLPINDGYSEGGTLRDMNKPYLLFHLNAGVSFSLDFGEGMEVLNEVVFSIPGSLKATAVLDIFDPYFYLAYSRTGGIDMNKLKKKEDTTDDGLLVYEIRDENDEHVVMAFTLDPETGVLLEQNFLDNTQVYYESNTDGDYVQQNVPDSPTILAGSQFPDADRRKQNDPSDSESDKQQSAFDLIDAIGFSYNGWIPFNAATKGVMPFDVAEFSGQIYMRGAIPMTSFLTLDGDVITYKGEYGVAQGGNGNVSLGIPGLPDFIDFDIELGNATAAYKIVTEEQKTFVNGQLKPDTAFLEDYLPMMPSMDARVVGYVGDDIQNTLLTIEGETSIGAQTLGSWIGLNLQDLSMTSAKMVIDVNGVEVSGMTRMQISPDIQVNSDISVFGQVTWANPDDMLLRLTGNMDVFGVALENVTLEISARGMAVNGAFVTPATRVAMAGSITAAGPQLSGSGAIELNMAEITGAMRNAYSALVSAQQDVQRLESEISKMRAVVQGERDRDQLALTAAQEDVDAAKQSINSLNSKIASHYRAIKARNSQISDWYRWYKAAKWHQKASRYARYTKEKSWRKADIAQHYTSIAALKVSLEASKAALNLANLAVEGVKAGMDLTTIDLDPRVAALITARDSAILALEVAKQPFQNVPYIDGTLSGNIELNLGIQGIWGSVSAELSGYSLLQGNVEVNPTLQACVTVPTFGHACTAL